MFVIIKVVELPCKPNWLVIDWMEQAVDQGTTHHMTALYIFQVQVTSW